MPQRPTAERRPQPPQQPQPQPQQQPQGQQAPQQQPAGPGPDAPWRPSANDERWRRAEQMREPQTNGLTTSGLPRRTPQANLVSGSAEASPLTGPQVSRSPEEVRGRLTNLRRGIQQGRQAGAQQPGAARPAPQQRPGFDFGGTSEGHRGAQFDADGNNGFGPEHQER
ncbi:putative two-component system sensor kinase [Kitasatospora cheerisanensis KCTC 2395]|uniref:Putative two-component system sensor kinase n=2 Tax=Kitasatospora cheerisanensis TaxID=81942 RepID=A0A066YY67_9ACTN|nr:putative two-component system sensor kinase [Kitasatospora cheerisanensis KCTC 2395]